MKLCPVSFYHLQMLLHNKEELLQLVATKLSIEEILDLLDWDIYNLVNKLEEEIMENAEEFQDACE